MRLILARHGNTFRPADKVFWVGKRNDLPLVEEGLVQAECLGRALSTVPLKAVYCAPLKRTRKFAETVVDSAGQAIEPIEDDRLTELDYGDWSGLSDHEIAEQFGWQCLLDWSNQAKWPSGCGWTGTEEDVSRETAEFVREIASKYDRTANVLIVSSNGRLRYFLKLVPGEFARRVAQKTLKVGTGKSGVLVVDGERVRLPLWNEAPEALSAMLVSDCH